MKRAESHNREPSCVFMHPSDFKARIDFRHPLIPREGLSFPKFERLLVAQDLNEILPLVHELSLIHI